jgi:tryptophan synthase beta chain
MTGTLNLPVTGRPDPAEPGHGTGSDEAGAFPRGRMIGHGGRFAPEALMAALDELTVAYQQARADPAFQAQLRRLLKNYAGRPTLLTEAKRFGQQAGRLPVLLKREDLTHTGSHKINNVLGQALLARGWARRGSSPRPAPASTAWPPRPRARCSAWTASSTWARRTPRRQALNVSRMRMLGAEVIPVTAGTRTLKDAMNEAFRDWVTTVGHPLLHRLGGRPASVPDDGQGLPAGDRPGGPGAGAQPPAGCRTR